MRELKKISEEELNEILIKHQLWLEGKEGGERADLSNADLSNTDLSNTDLSNTDLSNADLSNADLSNADLSNANLIYANLSNTDLSNADLRYADLRYANLSNTNLRYANLSNTDLIYANLSNTNLSGSFGLMSSIDFMNYNFEKTNEGYIAYKTFGFYYSANKNWKIEVGSVIEEEVNCNRIDACGCGINVAPLDWVRKDCDCIFPIYKVLIRNEWLMGVCVPYITDGKIRCAKAEIIGIVEEGE